MAAFDAQQMSDAYALLQGLLKEYGLLSLGPRLWGFITKTGSTDPNQLSLWIEQQPEFKTRFPAIELRKQAGLSPISPQEYLQYEREARQLMQKAGMPAGFYDKSTDFTSLLAKDVSIRELGQRVEQGYDFVARATPEVKAQFAKYFGVNSDAALAAYFLDPTKATDVIMENVTKAQIGGAAAQMGLNINIDVADRLTDMGVDYKEALAGMAQIAQLAPLFEETVGESAPHMGGTTGTREAVRRAPRLEDFVSLFDDKTTNAMTTNAAGPKNDSEKKFMGVKDPHPKLPGVLRDGLRWDAKTGEVVEDVTWANDQTGENEGIAMVFNTDPAAKARALRRMQEREAMLSGGGGAVTSGTGSGLGSAEARRRR